MTTFAAPASMPATAAVPPQRISRLFRVELRKTIDTRAGRTMLASVLLLSVAITVWASVRSFDDEIRFTGLLEGIALPMTMLLPVVGVLAMTSEWSQRTALTTFTLSPRRIRVLLCKLGAALVIGIVMTSIAVACALIAYPISTSHNHVFHTNSGFGTSILSAFIAVSLNIVMGAAFGSLLTVSAAALVAFFAGPLLWTTIAVQLLGRRADWLDVTGAIGNISQRQIAGHWPQTITSITLWIVIPMAVGLWVSARREVK